MDKYIKNSIPPSGQFDYYYIETKHMKDFATTAKKREL